MATATRKRPRATAVNQELVGQASAFLQELPEKQKEDLSLREAVEQMQEPLKAALAKGYSYADLAEMLAGKGINISALTLKNYVPSGKRQTAKTKAKRVKKSVGEAATLEEPVSAEATSPQEPVETPSGDATTEPTPTPTKARKGRAKSSETAKSAAAKTKAGSETSTQQSRTRGSSTVKATTKLPSTKGRRKSEAAK